MQLAGVRLLGSVVEIELLECIDLIDDHVMTERICSRRNEIGRVLDAHLGDQATLNSLECIEHIQCRSAQQIEIQYGLSFGNREVVSQSEQVPALYRPDRETLLTVRRDGSTSWAAIARELAIALCPDGDSGRYAAGLLQALIPDGAEEAKRALDELGYAQLDASRLAPASADDAFSELSEVGAEDSSGDSQADGGGLPEPAPEMDVNEALAGILGSDAPVPTPPVWDDTGDAPIGGVSEPHDGKPKGSGSRPDVLRTYPAPHGPAKGMTGEGDGGHERRTAVDRARIDHVVTYERTIGRNPKVMPHGNPGYDVKSRDVNGRLARLIEVKSLSDEWRNNWAVLSREQFSWARAEGDRYWLYVMECAL